MFEAFARYRDMGPARSIAKVARVMGRTNRAAIRYLEEASSRWGWVARAAAWDAHVDEEAQAANKKAVIDMHNRHILVAEGIIKKLATKLLAMSAEEIRASDIAALLRVSTQLERSARGQASEVIEVRQRAAPRPVLPASVDSDSLAEIVARMRERGALPGESDEDEDEPDAPE